MNRDTAIAVAVIGSGAAFGLLGAYSSFEAVNETMQPSFGAKAWTVPIGIDFAIAAATAADLWQAARGKRTWWLRWVPPALSAVTIWLNVLADPTVEGKVAHAGLVGLWVVFIAAAAHEVKLRAVGRRPKVERMDQIRRARFWLAPVSSLRILRLMVLWEERSYSAALERWKARIRTRKQLAHDHGRLRWRWLAPIDDRLDYRFAQLADTRVIHAAEPEPKSVPAPKLNGDLESAARAHAARLRSNGEDVNRKTLTRALRGDGYGVSNAKAGELLRAVQ